MRASRWALPGMAALAVLAAVGCGRQAPTPRAQVAGYVARVNRIESTLSVPVASVTRVSAAVSGAHNRGLTSSGARGASVTLAGALAQIQAQQRRLRALTAPAPASRLRSLLLRLTAGEAAQTRQLQLLIAFLPRFSSVMAPLGPALTDLERALSVRQAAGSAAVAATYAAKAAALRRFRLTTQRIAKRLRGLTPPDVSRPTYQAQLTSLNGMGASAGRLATALGGGVPGNVTPLLVDFDRAAVGTRVVSVQTAERSAIRAYDARSGTLAKLSEQIDRERLRLAQTLH